MNHQEEQQFYKLLRLSLGLTQEFLHNSQGTVLTEFTELIRNRPHDYFGATKFSCGAAKFFCGASKFSCGATACPVVTGTGE